ncbi:MAG TPA: hypothetical protein ENL05_01505 [Candidatus Moranbacteria bacterium]|nr:hypothetical protein [Candidatus Moranbacteria bacterium]
MPLESKNIFSKKESQSRLDFWPPDVQLIGKDILRVHATIWPAILTYLNVEWPKQIFVHGHILSGGRKMSKTIGNVIGIDEMLNKFGTEATRYLLMSAGTFGEDIDVTMERMIEKYNADLANGLGNLTSRILKLSSISLPTGQAGNFPAYRTGRQFLTRLPDGQVSNQNPIFNEQFSKKVNKLELDKALGYIWKIIRDEDKFIDKNEPWKLMKTDKKKFEEVMKKLLLDLANIANLLVPFMPETSEKIKKALKERKIKPLFQRIK